MYSSKVMLCLEISRDCPRDVPHSSFIKVWSERTLGLVEETSRRPLAVRTLSS